MKYITVAVLVLCVLTSACAVREHIETTSDQPELVSMAPLPPLSSTLYTNGTKFNVLLHVLQDGSVEYVKILGSSGDADWDAAALESIKQWSFAAPRRHGEPADLWFRQLIIVQIQEPVFMAIGQVVCSSQQEADSLYSLVRTGNILDDLFNGSLGTVNIMQYPQRVRERIKTLAEGEISAPLRVGEKYIIYKRFPATGKNTPAL